MMNTELSKDTAALTGGITVTFFKYLLPSMLGLLAMTSASLVDGVFIGNYVGTTALAAVNLIIPIMTLLFGVGLMLAIGGSVRCGKYLGENKPAAASAIFSKTLIFTTLYSVAVVILAMLFEQQLFSALGATPNLFPVMAEYYRIIMPFLVPQIITLVLYFFARMDGAPNLAAGALAVGSVANIVLDYLFIAEFGWGLQGAAWATGLSQLLSALVLLLYFVMPSRNLLFSMYQQQWREVWQAAYNGISEFINEISGGIIAFILNWMLIQRAGVDGVAAITVVNYLFMVGFMVFFAISDTIQVMVSQNFGAQNIDRIKRFMLTAMVTIAVLSAAFISALLWFSDSLIHLFVDESNAIDTVALAKQLIVHVWPVYIFAGINMLISGYLTAVHLPFQSGVVALCRSLVFPASLLLILYFSLADYRFVIALPIAELFSFVITVVIFWRYLPRKIITISQADQ